MVESFWKALQNSNSLKYEKRHDYAITILIRLNLSINDSTEFIITHINHLQMKANMISFFRYSSFILLLTCLSLSHSLQAKVLDNTEKVDKVSDYFMSQIATGEVASAYSLIAAYLGVDAASFEERGKKAEMSLSQLNSTLGKPLSFALLDKQAVGDHFYKTIYLLKYESAALVWELNFYQPQEGWKLVDINFNTDINALFK